MPKPTVYVETTVISYLTARPQLDPIATGHQFATKKWWHSAQGKYELLISQLVIDECSAGDANAAAERLEAIRDLSLVPVTPEVNQLSKALLRHGALPQTEPKDATHIAFAAAHGIEYIATWNFRHIANPAMRRKIEEAISKLGFRPPIICSPEELSEEPSHVD